MHYTLPDPRYNNASITQTLRLRDSCTLYASPTSPEYNKHLMYIRRALQGVNSGAGVCMNMQVVADVFRVQGPSLIIWGLFRPSSYVGGLVLPETLGCSMVGPHVGTLAQCPYTRAGLLLPTHAHWRSNARVISEDGN